MASWIVHLRVAEALLERTAGLNSEYFAMGNIAPDSGIPDENWENFEPPPEILHFKGSEDAPWILADLEFYRQHIQPTNTEESDIQRASFVWGYFFHLLVDNLWDDQIDQPTRDRFSAEFEADPKFIWEVKRDWYGLDFAHVRSNPNSIFWSTFLDCGYTQDYLPFMPPGNVQERIAYINEFYQRTDQKLEDVYGVRPEKYLSEGEMDDFIDLATEKLHKIYHYLCGDDPKLNGFASALELAYE